MFKAVKTLATKIAGRPFWTVFIATMAGAPTAVAIGILIGLTLVSSAPAPRPRWEGKPIKGWKE